MRYIFSTEYHTHKYVCLHVRFPICSDFIHPMEPQIKQKNRQYMQTLISKKMYNINTNIFVQHEFKHRHIDKTSG